jgi:phosphatidylethanolamine/phosphatidyl-N-methylethanolamine N-methyltransferase
MFVKDVARRPKQMGAIVPSGAELARVMLDAAEVGPGHVLVELGAGTGPITRVIRKRFPDNPLLAFEPGSSMAAALRREFPEVRVTERYAQELPEVLREWGPPAVDRVISGLPWTIWPRAVQNAIMEAIVASLNDDGRLVTFTYVHSQVLPGAGALRDLLSAYFGRVERTRVAWNNVPPAFAFVASQPKRESLSTSTSRTEP